MSSNNNKNNDQKKISKEENKSQEQNNQNINLDSAKNNYNKIFETDFIDNNLMNLIK